MLTVQNQSFISPIDKLPSFAYGFKKTAGRLVTVKSKRGEFPEKSNGKRPVLQIKVPNTILARSAIALLSLGFIDAGYSGDWSRIGVISKETEQLLKISAFLLVPFSILLALSFSNQSTD